MDVDERWFRWRGATLGLSVRVHTGARVDCVEAPHAGRLRLKLRARPIEGQANRALATFLANEFGVAKRDVEIARGTTNRNKELAISTPRTIPAWFREFGGRVPSCG